MDDLLRECGCRPDFVLEFVKYGQYSPHSSTKSVSAPGPLATVPILGQPPRTTHRPTSSEGWLYVPPFRGLKAIPRSTNADL